MANKKTLTNEKIMWAYEECLKDPGILAGSMAEKLGVSPRYMTLALMKLADKQVFTVEKQGNAYLFRLNPDAPEL